MKLLVYLKNIDRNYYKVILLIILLFALSANIAWFNPGERAAKTHPKIPVYWQYDCDASVDFLTGAFFPEYFRYDDQRVNRPAFPLFAKIFGEFMGLLALPIIKMGVLAKTMIGYALLKMLYYAVGAILLYRLTKEWLGERTALLSVVIVFFHPFSLYWMATFATAPSQFITPIIIAFLFNDWLKNRSPRKNFVYSIITGVLLLIKENYALYLAILTLGLLKKKYRAAGTSLAGVLIPQAVWQLALAFYHIPFRNTQMAQDNQLTWIFNDLIFRHPVDILQTIMASIGGWMTMFAGYYFFFIALALLAFAFRNIKKRFIRPGIMLFFGLFLFFSWLQALAVNLYDKPFRTADFAFVIFPLGIFAALQIFSRYFSGTAGKKIIISGVILYIILSLTSLIRLPWVHPYNQENVLGEKQEKIDTYGQGVIYQSRDRTK